MIDNDIDFNTILKSKRIASFLMLADKEEKYHPSYKIYPVNQRYDSASYITTIKEEVVWSKVEDRAMEEETLLAVQNALGKMYNAPIRVLGSTTEGE